MHGRGRCAADVPSPAPTIAGGAPEAKLARRLVSEGKTATLATLAMRPAGHPFGTLVVAVPDAQGRPILLLSGLAEHTKNLEASPLASLLFADYAADDPLSSPRVTLLGTCRRVGSLEIEDARAIYLARYPQAQLWASFAVEPGEIRLVEGFGKMDWIDVDAYRNV
jgi:heme iron utilization protein